MCDHAKALCCISQSITPEPDNPTDVANTDYDPAPPPNTLAGDLFEEELERHGHKLSPAYRQAFINASSATNMIDIIQGLNDQHREESRVRAIAVKVQGFLEVVDGYLNVVAVLVQHNPYISALVVGGLKLFVDVR